MVAAVAEEVVEGQGKEKVDVVIFTMIVMIIIITKVDAVVVDGEVGGEVEGVVEGARDGREEGMERILLEKNILEDQPGPFSSLYQPSVIIR